MSSTTKHQMDTTTLGPLRRRYVLLSLAATVAMYGAGAGFLIEQSQGELGTWAVLSDVGSLLFALALIPVVLGIAAELRPASGRPDAARAVGLVSTVTIALGAAWLLAGDAVFVPEIGLAAQLLGLTLLGFWLVMVGLRTRRTGRWGPVVAWSAIVGGVGHTVGSLAAALQLFDSPLFFLAYAATVVGFLTWLGALVRATR